MRKNILIGVLGMIAILLSACSTKNEDMTVQVEGIESATASEDTDEEDLAISSGEEKGGNTEPQDQSALSGGSADAYREIYRQVILDMEGDAGIFSLIYLDDDDIPELVVCDRGYGTYSIYTVKNGDAFCMMDAMTTVEMTYFERKGVVSQFARWNGGGEEGGYGWYHYQISPDRTLVDGDLPVLHDTYDAVYDEEENWTGEGVWKYYHLDQEIDEADYQKRMDDLGIVEGNGKTCTENAFGKKEMLNALGEQILEQSFETELDGFGKVIFAPFVPLSYPSENPDYGTTMFGDVRFMLLSASDKEQVYEFPGETEDNILTGFIQFSQILSVAFKDYNEDGRTDILLILEYLNAEGEPFRKARIYTQKDGEKEFRVDRNLSEFLWDYTESMERLLEGIAVYRENPSYDPGDLSEEELIGLLNERVEYYRKSAYYPEITDYWENVREVRDISNHITPLYESDIRYLTREDLAFDPPVVIHLAKNEIYARHGYIFKDQDLYNYFMGCIWYMPTVAPADFSDEVFNEYEKENLKLLEELDTL